jgi:Metallo-peptidase family M12
MRLLRCLTSLAALTFACVCDAHSRSRNPLNYLTILENPQINTPSRRVHAFSKFDLTFDLHGESQHIKLSLEPNYDILGEDSFVEYLDKYGNVRHAERIVREDHKVFLGKSWVREEDDSFSNVGWARIVMRRDGVYPLFEGAFTIMGDHHHIQMKSNYLQTKHEDDPMLEEEEDDDEYMTVFRDSDISWLPSKTELKRSTDLGCRADKLEFNSNPNHPVYQNILKRADGHWGSIDFSSLLGKRQSIDGGGTPGGGNSGGVNLKTTIGDSSGCPTIRKVALLGVATDCTYTASFNSTESTRLNVITQVNTASDLYQSTFNVTLGLQNLTVSDAECPSTASSAVPWNIGCGSDTIIDRLNLFSEWRGERPDSNAYWSLFSTCNTGAEVGLAWLGQLCNNVATSQTDTSGDTQTVAGANVIIRTSTEWQVFAHETGHTFGAVHDCDSRYV